MKHFHHIKLFSYHFFIFLAACVLQHTIVYGKQLSAFVSHELAFFAPGRCDGMEHSLCMWNGISMSSLVNTEVLKNTIPHCANPLKDASISVLSPFSTGVLAAIAKNPSVFYITKQKDAVHVVIAEDVRDAHGAVTSEIKSLAGIMKRHPVIIAAIAPAHQTWGQPGCGLALITTAQSEKQEEEQKKEATPEELQKDLTQENKSQFNIVNAVTGELKGNRAVAIDNSEQSPVQINGGIGHIYDDRVTLYWEPFIERLYIGLHVKTSPNANTDQGASALLMARIENNKLIVSPVLAPDAIASDSNVVVGARGPNQEMFIDKIRSLHTSTSLSYLIFAEGTTSKSHGLVSIYALPITNARSKASARAIRQNHEHGKIASCTQEPVLSFFKIKRGRFEGRQHAHIAQTPDDLPDMHSEPVLVGGVALPEGTLIDIFCVNDLVFAIVEQAGQHTLYKSQALFRENSTIGSWTSWTPIFNAPTIIGGMPSAAVPLSILYTDEAEKIATVHPQWLYTAESKEVSIQSLANTIAQHMPPASGGVTTIAQLPLAKNTDHASAIFAIAGNGIVLLTEMRKQIKESLSPQKPLFSAPLLFQNKSLKQVGHVTSACCIKKGDRAWLIAGGVNGIAVCADANGHGFEQLPAQDEYAQFTNTYEFRHFKSIPCVRAVVADESFLYVLTNNQLIRYTITDHPDEWHGVTIADNTVVRQLYTELLVEGACALLGTTHGLYRIGNGCDVRTLENAQSAQWTLVDIPRSHVCSIQQLFDLTSTDGQSKNRAHQIYMLGYSTVLKESYLFRIYIDNTHKSVDQDTVQLVTDYACKDVLTSYLTVPLFINRYATDGLMHIINASKPVQFLYGYPFLTGGKQLKSGKGYDCPLNLPDSYKQITTSCITPNGDMLIGGPFGVAIYYL